MSESDSSDTEDVLRPFLANPVFNEPMYRRLLDLGPQFLVPSLGEIAPNTVSALITNRKFIESFLLGANHEFASELRWRGYPTDLRGSYFRKFWDSTDLLITDEDRRAFRESPEGAALLEATGSTWEAVEAAIDSPEAVELAAYYEIAFEAWLNSRESSMDIAPFDDASWHENSPLGVHKSVGSPDDDNEVVLLIRADILTEFPGVLLYLARKDGSGGVSPPSVEPPVYPTFAAELAADVTSVGFPVAESMAKQCFLIFEERSSEPRFGLDSSAAGTAAGDLSWSHFPGFSEGGEGYLNDVLPRDNDAQEHWNNPAFIPSVFHQPPERMAIDLAYLLS